MKRSTFGGLLTAFQKQSRLALEVARRNLKKRNPKVKDFEFRESKIVTHDGDTVCSVELWQKVDEEHIRISGKIETTTLPKAEAKKAVQEPAPPPMPSQPAKEVDEADELKDIMA